MARIKSPCSLFNSYTSISSFSLMLLQILIHIQRTQGAYNEQYLDSMGCSSMKKISLSNFPNNTFVLKLSRWEDYHLPSAFMNFQCDFQVLAPKGHGIMAITQGLHLRIKSKSSHTCRDYIKFEQNDGRETGPICGEVNVSDLNDKPKNLIGPRTFYDPNGILDVFFSTDDSSNGEVQKPIFLQLVFTTYQECTSMDLITHKIRSCSEGKGNACIASNLFCDGVINCGFKGDFAADENDCGRPIFDDRAQNKSVEVIGPLDMNSDFNEFIGRNKSSRVNNNVVVHQEITTNSQFDIGSLPVHAFALISAAAGALLVLVIIFICCCLGRLGRLSPRNETLRQDLPERAIHLGLSHSSSVATGGPSFISRMTPSGKLVKPREDLPPPYDAIFPQANPEKK